MEDRSCDPLVGRKPLWYHAGMGHSTIPTPESSMLKVSTIDEPAKRFFGEHDISDEASTFEENGRRVYYVVRPADEAPTPGANWTETQSKRRHHLIDLQLGGVISAVELLELTQLNEEFDRHVSRVAPLPMSYALEVLAKLTASVGGKP